MGGTCSMNWKNEKCTQNFSQKTGKRPLEHLTINGRILKYTLEE